jgi:5-methylcytosine-specific restriction protein A
MSGNIERLRGRHWQKVRQHILVMEPLCRPCAGNGHATAAVEIDHIVPLHKGGNNEHANLQPICRECHDDKTREDLGHQAKPTYGADGWPVWPK